MKINGRGTVTLPKEMRSHYALKENDLLIAEETAEGILLRPAAAYPIEVYSAARIREFDAEEKRLAKHYGQSRAKKGRPKRQRG